MKKILVIGGCGVGTILASELNKAHGDIVAFTDGDIQELTSEHKREIAKEVKHLTRQQECEPVSRGKGAKRQRKKDRGW